MNDTDLALRAAQQSLDNLDDTLREMADLLLEGMPDRAERRRYALLEAAVVIMQPGLVSFPESRDISHAVDAAEQLLAEIEKGEKTES